MGITITTGRVAEIDCDAIINPCDEKLSGCIGIDLQVHRAGGRWLTMHCKELSPIFPGQAVLTEGYGMKARHIIHTAVPWYMDRPEQLDELRACYRNSLKIADKLHVKRILLPLMGLGFRAFPQDFVERVAREECEAFLERNPHVEILLLQYDQSWDEEDEEAIMNG